MQYQWTEWDEDVDSTPDEEYRSLVRSLRRKMGFSLFFVRCSPVGGQELIERVRADVSQKKADVLELKEPIANLIDLVKVFPDIANIKILFVVGLEKSLVEYIRTGYGGQGDYYNLDTVPPILSHLNWQRENFRDKFRHLCFVFLLPQFAIKYIIRRAPDFYDWASGKVDFPTSKELVAQESKNLRGDYEEYLQWTPKQRKERIIQINELLLEPNQNKEHQSSLLLEKGNIFTANEHYEEAIAAYDQALQFKPDDHQAWYNRGIALFNLGRNEEAIASYDQALQIKPDYSEARLDKVNALCAMGKYEDAKFTYKQALKNRPEYDKRGHKFDIAINKVFGTNLPPRDYLKFVGRKDEIKELMQFLLPTDRDPVITIAGIGGMGKTALAIETAYRCLEAKLKDKQDPQIPEFKRIIFISAQDSFLLPNGINSIHSSIHTLADISRFISKALNEYGIMSVSPETQSKLITQSLKNKGQTLIIIDNLETLENPEEVIKFLRGLPINVKSIVTSRKLADATYVPIRLSGLSLTERLELLQQHIERNNILMNDDEKTSLCQASDGVPLVIVYVVGCLVFGAKLPTILERLKNQDNDFTKFCFDKLFEELTPNSIQLLFGLSLFPYGIYKEFLLNLLKIEETPKIKADLEKLEQVLLIHRSDKRFKILPPTREYVRSKLTKNINAQALRESWKNCYLLYTQKHGGDDWGNWREDYDVIDNEWGNLQELLRWCQSQNDYETVWQLWERLNKIAYLYGYWTERIDWLDYLTGKLEQHGKRKELVEVISSKAWTMIQMEGEENLNKAKIILDRAWLLRSDAPAISHIIATNLAVLNIRREQFDESDRWFKEADKSLNQRKLENDKNDDKNKKEIERTVINRAEIRIQFYRGEKEHRLKNYEQAKKYFQEVADKALSINWLRFVSASKELLADIAIRNNQINEAETLVEEGMHIAEQNNDRHRLAFYLKTRARLEKLKQNFEDSLKFASKSLELFERLKMEKQAESVRNLISEVERLKTST